MNRASSILKLIPRVTETQMPSKLFPGLPCDVRNDEEMHLVTSPVTSPVAHIPKEPLFRQNYPNSKQIRAFNSSYSILPTTIISSAPCMLFHLNYLHENDVDYLIDDNLWAQRISERVSLNFKFIVIQRIGAMLHDLTHGIEYRREVIERVIKHGAEYTYLSEYDLSSSTPDQKKDIEACFIASILRFLILLAPSDTTIARYDFKAKLEHIYKQRMNLESQSSNELTYLFRFERAILMLKDLTNGVKKKGLFLTVGSLLEGSHNSVRYITGKELVLSFLLQSSNIFKLGGHSSKETKRRLAIIEYICDLKVKKRRRKVTHSIEDDEEEEEQEEEGSMEEIQALDSLYLLADVAKEQREQYLLSSILNSDIIVNVDKYLLYFQYQEALLHDRFDVIESFVTEIRDFSPSLTDPSLFYQEYSTKLQDLYNLLQTMNHVDPHLQNRYYELRKKINPVPS